MTSVSSRFRLRSQHTLTYSGRPSEVGEPSGAQIAEFAGDHALVPIVLDCVSDQFLIAVLPVSVRAVEKIYADLACAAQGSLHLCRAHRRTASSSHSRGRSRKPRSRQVAAAASFDS